MTSNGQWKELTESYINPNWKNGDPWHTHWLSRPTGKKQCNECMFVTTVDDVVGVHVCPQLKDGYGTMFTIGDQVVCYATGRIRWGVVTKWNQKTGKLSVREEHETGVNNYVINTLGKVVRVDNDK